MLPQSVENLANFTESIAVSTSLAFSILISYCYSTAISNTVLCSYFVVINYWFFIILFHITNFGLSQTLPERRA